jgi:hypothetical protein
MLDRIVVRGGALSALAVSAALLMAATRGTAAPLTGHHTAMVGTTTVKVQNDALSGRLVYLTMDGQRHWLGVAGPGATTDFTVPRRYVAGRPSVRFLADPRGGAPLDESQRMQLIAGDSVRMVILPGR